MLRTEQARTAKRPADPARLNGGRKLLHSARTAIEQQKKAKSDLNENAAGKKLEKGNPPCRSKRHIEKGNDTRKEINHTSS